MTGFVFDIDDTLYCREDLIWQAVNEAACGSLTDRNGFISLFYVRSDDNFHLVESGQITAQESNIWRFEECFRSFGVCDPEARALDAAKRYTDLQKHVTLSAPLEEMFGHLVRAGHPLAVLTNGETQHQWEKYRMLHLSRWIPEEHVIVSGEAGVTKPDPAIFRIAEQRLAMKPSDLWMVGDSLGGDIKGASLAGWHSVWINRRDEPSGSLSPDLVFRSEYELAGYLTGMADNA